MGGTQIPESVVQCARLHNCEFVTFVSKCEQGDIYSVSSIAPGDDFPTGLPSFVVLSNGECRYVDGLEGLEIVDLLYGNK